tara:strand:+ start:89 stop:445 length:357 start_codon:yes stop_codon:yes gene_type:complete
MFFSKNYYTGRIDAMNTNISKLADATNQPVITTFAAAFLNASENEVRKIAQARGKKYKSLTSVLNRKVSMEAISAATKIAIRQALYASACVDTTKIPDASARLREENLRHSINNYLQS